MANVEETVDFEPKEDDLIDEDVKGSSPRAPIPKLKSVITTTDGGSSGSKKIKGPGFCEETAEAELTEVNEEAQEDHLHDTFGEFGEIKNLHLNLDRRSRFIKGYALIEYENFEEAERAINEMDGNELLTQTIHVDWAFNKGPFRKRNAGRSEVIILKVQTGGDSNSTYSFLQGLCHWLL
ncbi:RNA-binding protein 8A [Capsicum annuum]|nr:RNA-binding protein 8A [Capsicum annuum]KAF3641357.1 RNA-binding protein 8A [Capsicum annuum]